VEANHGAGRSTPLAGAELEQLACTAYLLGRADECRERLQEAHHVYLAAGNRLRAARCLFWVAFTLLLEGELAQASGWLGRAGRLVEHERDCAEHGLLLLPATVQAAMTGDHESARDTAARAAEIGARLADADLLALAVHFHGRALVDLGRVREGVALLDEAMVAVMAEEVWPPVAGNLYCSTIDACQQMADLRRSGEWTKALEVWWGKRPDMVTFTGQCLVHRAEILQMRGEWPAAVDAAERARERLAIGADKHATGGAWYRQAEIRRVSGDLAAAEAGYREASRWGHDPQPGLALLRLAQGEVAAAQAAIRRAVAETTDRLRRGRLLPAQVEIMLAANDVPAASSAADELAEIARDYGTPALDATARHALGAVMLVEGDAEAALVQLRRAWRVWQGLDAPYEAARVRVLIALACQALDDVDDAVLELDGARGTFERLGAAHDLANLVRLVAPAGRPTGGLTARELQVLRLLATGRTNRAIAAELVLADKTVDRHVTNIFAKLGVSSRAAATAYAYEHRMLG
jgi:ATP/maltotriose-dependent transcriptional regulator MalT